ncbi:MAG: oligosaccharide flippase family protein [Pseudomonadales bacterium]|nr:oligosaccharide flippase family protein [Pseudomonadales bacterium]
MGKAFLIYRVLRCVEIKFITISEDKKKLLSNFFSLTVLQIFTYLLPLLTLPYLTRVLGAERFGAVVFAQSFIMFFNVLVDYGFNLYATREISIHRDNEKKVLEIFSSVMIIKVFLVVVSLLALTAIVFTFDRFLDDVELYYLTFFWVFGQALFPIWYFQGMEQMKYVTIVNVVAKIIFTVLIFALVRNPGDYYKVPILNGFGMCAGACLSLVILRIVHNQGFGFYRFGVLQQHFRESSQFFLSRFSVAIYTTSNTFVIGLFSSNDAAGYYSIADKLYQALQQIYHPVVQSLYPYVAKQKNIAFFKKIFKVSVFLNFGCIALLFCVGEYVFSSLFTETVGKESLEVFYILLFAALVVVPSMLLGYPFLGALGFGVHANASVVFGSVFHLSGLGVLVLVGDVTIYSIAYMVVATELLVLVYRIYWVKSGLLWLRR